MLDLHAKLERHRLEQVERIEELRERAASDGWPLSTRAAFEERMLEQQRQLALFDVAVDLGSAGAKLAERDGTEHTDRVPHHVRRTGGDDHG